MQRKSLRQIFIHPISYMAVIYNCEATNALWTWKRRSSKVRRSDLFFAPRIYLPNCQYLMFNVFVRLLILAGGIIFAWFMHALCSAFFLFTLDIFLSYTHNKSNIVFFIIHSHLAPDTSYSAFLLPTPSVGSMYTSACLYQHYEALKIHECLLINYVPEICCSELNQNQIKHHYHSMLSLRHGFVFCFRSENLFRRINEIFFYPIDFLHERCLLELRLVMHLCFWLTTEVCLSVAWEIVTSVKRCFNKQRRSRNYKNLLKNKIIQLLLW